MSLQATQNKNIAIAIFIKSGNLKINQKWLPTRNWQLSLRFASRVFQCLTSEEFDITGTKLNFQTMCTPMVHRLQDLCASPDLRAF